MKNFFGCLVFICLAPIATTAAESCVTVEASSDWTSLTLDHGDFKTFTTSGSWTTDAARLDPVGPFGHKGKFGQGGIPEFDALYYQGTYSKFGEVLMRTPSQVTGPIEDFRVMVLNGGNPLIPRKGDTVELRINDTTLDNNAGNLRICIQ